MKKLKLKKRDSQRIDAILAEARKGADVWNDTRERLAREVIEAFYDVILGDGIGFYEADCIDDYLAFDDPERQKWRAQDERNHWENMLAKGWARGYPRLNVYSAFSFMDRKGKLFALPCYLIWSLKGDDFSLSFHLSHASFTPETVPLNAAQQRVLRQVVALHIRYYDDTHAFLREDWEKADKHLAAVYSDYLS